MANRYWMGGANDGDWGNTVNWAATQGGAGSAGVPATGDNVYIHDTAQAITGNLSQSGVTLASLSIQFAGTIGTAGSSLTIGVSGTTTIASQSSLINLAAGTDPIANLKARSIGGTLSLTGGTFTNVELGRNGYCSIGGAAVTTLTGTGMSCGASSGTAFTTVNWHGGTLSTDRSIATLNEYGPTSNVVTTGSAAISTIAYVFGASNYIHNSSGTITNISVGAGSRATAKGSIYPVTITNSTVYGNGYIFSQEDVPVTFTNATAKIGIA